MLKTVLPQTGSKKEILELLQQIPDDWEPHRKLEFLKVFIRTVISGLVRLTSKELGKEITELEKA